MSVSIVTFANLGKKKNLKTTDIEPVIQEFARRNELAQVICQLNTQFFFTKTVESVPRLVHYVLRALERPLRLSRRYMESVFDYFASRKLQQTTTVFLHGGDFLSRTVVRARRNGSITIDIAVMANIDIFVELEKKEAQYLGLAEQQGVYARMQKHVPSVPACDYIIAISDFAKQSYINAGFREEKIYVASPDIDLARFQVKEEKRETPVFKVVYVAYTTSLKGLHYLLGAWKQLQLSNAELVIVGGYGDIPEELKQRYDATIANSRDITWIGHSNTPEDYYRDASLLVFPSLVEGFGRVTLEAMACGIPVITTENARGIVEDGKTGFVVPIRDAGAIAEKIQYLYDHRDIAGEMGREARKAVLNKKPFGEAVYEIYEDILEKERVNLGRDTIGRTV